ncbi:MAG: site-2 protease family protein [Atopobiaceae bacterium]|nr:site-2 protease family protein [Olsenella sp.]MDY3900661.1 site-2 protease family protein [Atopobiaceae bacterium]
MLGYSALDILNLALSLALVIFSAMVHEVAHGWVAYRLGDATAKRAGRLTLNPARHLDPFGSVVLPLLMAVAGWPVFAYAKPVPYNPNNLRNPRTDEVLVALAGPASNLLQALAGAAVYQLVLSRLLADGGSLVVGGASFWVLRALALYVYVNLVLMFFNLIPLPPLDGSKLVMPLLHGRARERYYHIQSYSLPILVAVLYLVPMVVHFDPLSLYLDATAGNLLELLLA